MVIAMAMAVAVAVWSDVVSQKTPPPHCKYYYICGHGKTSCMVSGSGTYFVGLTRAATARL